VDYNSFDGTTLLERFGSAAKESLRVSISFSAFSAALSLMRATFLNRVGFPSQRSKSDLAFDDSMK